MQPEQAPVVRYLLFGDGESPHLLKWARALVQEGPQVLPGFELWVASSRGFAAGFETLVPAARRLALATSPRPGGGNLGLLRRLPAWLRWLREVQPVWVHAHYLSSHGTLAWLARRFFGVRAGLLASAWGSDILMAPERSVAMRWLTRRVLADAALSTSDSEHMAARMRALGAREVMVFPFGLDGLPPPAAEKQPWLFFANRGLEALYAPGRVLQVFAAIHRERPQARLVVANDGALRDELLRQVRVLGVEAAVDFVGRLAPQQQERHYAQAQWFLSLPVSDSVSVSVIEAMAHGCIPILSDLPANRELVRSGDNGLVLTDGATTRPADLEPLLQRAAAIAQDNRRWVAEHALFAPAVRRFLQRVAALP